MSSTRPYLLRALYQWILDNGMTPYMLVDAAADGVMVPPQAVKDGRVVLNLAPRAVSGLVLGNDDIRLTTRFSGVSQQVHVPIAAALAIYARENGQGMMFAAEDGAGNPPPPPPDGAPSPDRPPRAAPHLRVIK